MTEQRLNHQDEIAENTAQGAMLGGMFVGLPAIGLLHAIPGVPKLSLKVAGYLAKGAAKTAINLPLGMIRGALSDDYAIADPSKYRFFSNPDHIKAYNESRDLFSQSLKSSKAAAESWKKLGGLKKEAFSSLDTLAKSHGHAITDITMNAKKETLAHFADGTIKPLAKPTVAAKAYLDESDIFAKHWLDAKNLSGKSGALAPWKKIQVARGIRGWLANPATAGSLALPAYRTMGTTVVPRIGLTLPKMAELTGHAIGRASKATGLLGFNVGADLLKGAGRDFFGMKGGGSSGIIKTAKAVAVIKAFAPLRHDIYFNSLASETSMEGNPMLSSLANAGQRAQGPDSFGLGYGMGEADRVKASNSKMMNNQNDSRSRFISSAAGLTQSLGRISGKVL